MAAGEKREDREESHAFREEAKADLASGRHLPQHVPTPNSRVRSRKEVAPLLTAVRMCRSETALHTQTIMRVL